MMCIARRHILAVFLATALSPIVADARPDKVRMVIAGPGYMWGIDNTIVADLKAEGVEVLTYPDTPMIDGGAQPPRIRNWEQLSRFNILIFGDQFYNSAEPSADTGEVPAHIRKAAPLLYRFLKEGGGIWFSGPGEADFGNTVKTMNYVMKELDAQAVQEVIKDTGNLVKLHHQRFGEWCWTDKITPHPLTQGVKGLWYPVVHAGDGGMGNVPIKAGPAWTVLTAGMPTAASYGIDTTDAAGEKLLKTPGVVKSSPNMIAVREYGRGRVVFWPMWSSFNVFSGSWYSDGMLLDGQRDGRKSGGRRLIKNLLHWLAEPSRGSKTVGTFDPESARPPKPPVIDVEAKLAAWRSPGRKDYPKQFRGLIGAHSTLSDGTSSPEEMVAGAREAGYDFIGFTENLAMMDEAKWKRLVAACDKANASGGAVLLNAPNKMWESQLKFSEPVSVEFLGVYLNRLPASGNNQLGLAPFGHGPDMVAWTFDGSVKPPKLVPLRAVGGKGCWKSGYERAVNLSDLPDITRPENAVDLRIDWWPGKKVRYYLNGKLIAGFIKSVPKAVLPVGVRDETVGHRMRAIKVTSLRRKKVFLHVDFAATRTFDTQATWRLLRKDPPVVQATPDFLAYPGLDFLDDANNRGLVFGQRWWPVKAAFSTQHPGRLRWHYSVSYQQINRPPEWPPRVIIRSQTNNKPPWLQGLWNSFAPYCYERGKLVDDSFHQWRRLIGRHVFFFYGLMAAHTVFNADDIAASAAEGHYQTYVRAGNLPQVLSRLKGCVGPMGYFASYISAGPEIVDFRAQQINGGEGANLAIEGNDRIQLHILVRAESGLREVAVYDGERLVRRLAARGNRFERFLTFHPDGYHVFSITVTDANGRQAVSWPAWTQVQERVHRRCGDNWNWMVTGKGRAGRPWHPHMLEATGGLGGSEPRYFCEPVRLAHGGLSPAIARYITPDFQKVRINGNPWPGNVPAHVLDFTTVGRYGEILTNVVRHDYLVMRADAWTAGAFQGPYKLIDTPWPADHHQWAPEPRFDGLRVAGFSGKVRFTRQVTTETGKPIGIRLGSCAGNGQNPVGKFGCIFEIKRPDGTSEKLLLSKLKDGTAYDGEVPLNGYAAWYGPDAPGSGGVIALEPGMRYNFYKQGTYTWLSFYKRVAVPVKPGTTVTWDCIYVNGSGATQNTSREIEDVYRGLGVLGKPTLYKVVPRVGKVAEQKLSLVLQPEDHGFSGRIVKTTSKLLPLHLPVFIEGLNPRWDACLWYRGKTHLEVIRNYRDPWGVTSPYRMAAYYEPREDEIQYIPVVKDDRGYCQVDTDKQDADIFIGHPLVCDVPEVFLTMVKAERGKCTFEVNNPTDKELVFTVRPAKGFEYTGQWTRKLTLPAGGDLVITVQ